jgi:hypothetical protein
MILLDQVPWDPSLGLSGLLGMDRKAAIEMHDERFEEAIGLWHGRQSSQMEFCDQTLLKDSEELLHPTFGLEGEQRGD